MKKDEVRIGCVYSAKVSGSIAPVRITEEKWKGDKHTGWVGTNTQTGRSVYIKSAQRLRAPAAAAHGGGGGVAGSAGEPSAKAASPVPPKTASGGTGKKVKKATGGQKGKRTRKPAKDRPLSALGAAALVLAEAKKPMKVSEILAEMEALKLWTSKAGKTPEATIYAAIIREIRDKGVDSRFEKKDRGLFAAAGEGA